MDTKNLLSASWVVVTLIYLYDDVLRICSGDQAKLMANMSFNQGIWLGIAILMLTPILMVFLTLVLPQPVSRWANIIVAILLSCSTWLACPPIRRYMTNSCSQLAWCSTGSRSGMPGSGASTAWAFMFSVNNHPSITSCGDASSSRGTVSYSQINDERKG
jgi:hypothetical protein